MARAFALLAAAFASLLKSRVSLQLENLALRHQIGVLQRSAMKRPKLDAADRLFWAWLCRVWGAWRSALVIVKTGYRDWLASEGLPTVRNWKIRRGQPGRPRVARETRELIRRMSRENPLWGAPRIHGELLKLGIDIGETGVSKYLIRHRQPLS